MSERTARDSSVASTSGPPRRGWGTWLRRLRGRVNPVVAVITLSLALSLTVGIAVEWWRRYQTPWQLVFAAGSRGGESYQIAETIRDHVHARLSNVRITVRPSKGTAANLALLRDGEAQLATAQADVALQRWTATSTRGARPGRTVAVLYFDKVQLLMCRSTPASATPLTVTEVFRSMAASERRPRVYVPYEAPNRPSGGQVETFLSIAEYFGVGPDEDFELVNDDGLQAPFCGASEVNNIIFRVRAEGNEGVRAAIQQGWRLASFTNVDALVQRNSALKPGWLSRGTYRRDRSPGLSSPEPADSLRTLEIGRLLLARGDDSVPDFVITEITRALNKEGPTLARREGSTTDRALKEIFLRIPRLNRPDDLKALGVPLHAVAAKFYEPHLTLSARLNESADLLSFILTCVTIGISLLIGLNRGAEWIRKKHVDDLVEQATRQMAPPATPYSPAGLPFREFGAEENALLADIQRQHRVFELVAALVDGRMRERKLELTFRRAADDFRDEEITQEAFRTFSEVHKSVRESIETANEKHRREIVEFYVSALLRRGSGPDPFAGWSAEQVLDQALLVLSSPAAFSRDSFRTLAEAYELAGRK